MGRYRRKIYIFCLVLGILAVIVSNKVIAEEVLSLDDLLEIISFNRHKILDGEIRIQLHNYRSPVLSKEIADQVVAEKLEEWRQHKIRSEKNISQKELQKSLGRYQGEAPLSFSEQRPRISECNLAFKRYDRVHSAMPYGHLNIRNTMYDRYPYTTHGTTILKEFTSSDNISTTIVNHTSTIDIVIGKYRLPHASQQASTGSRFPYHLLGSPSHEISRETVKDFYTKTMDSQQVYVIQHTPISPDLLPLPSDADGYFVETVLNPYKGFCVMQESVFVDFGGDSIFEVQRVSSDNYNELPGTIWLPFLIQIFSYDRNNPGKSTTTLEIMVYEADLNIGIPDEFFDFSERDVVQLGIDVLW